MNGGTYSLILLNVALTAAGQIMLKAGMMAALVQQAIGGRSVLTIGLAVAGQPLIWAGLGAYGVSLITWLVVLARIPVSSAYPFVALSIALTSVAGGLLFHDALSPSKVVGTLLILLGVITLSRG